MNRLSFISFSVLSILLLFSCGGAKEDESKTEVAARKVRVEEVKLQEVAQLSTFTANIEANRTNNILPAPAGRIRSISVDVGSRVAKGQVVVVMDAAIYSQQETQLATLKRDYHRFSELYEVGGISKQQLDQIKAQLDMAQTAQDNLRENTKLESPINGVVIARNFDPGDLAAGMPILTIANINPVKVKVDVSEAFYSQVELGMRSELQVDALGGDRFEGRVSLIHPTLNPVSHTFTVEIEVRNNDQRLRPGMFSRVTMNFGSNERPLVSDKAVLKQSGSNDRYVFVEQNGKAVYRLVELGKRIGDKFEIISGLQAGERIIVQGNSGLVDGSVVEVVQVVQE